MKPQHPGHNAFNALAKQQLDTALGQAARTRATGRLVDIGCGLKPYEAMFKPFVTAHVGVDHPDSPHARDRVDVLADARDIPLDDATFQTALMSELIEHLEEPGQVISEAHRLLTPGGKLIVSTPFMWPLHEEPRDFYRYTPHGLRYLLETAGFSDVTVQPVSGQWSTVHNLSAYALRRSPAARLGPALSAYLRLRSRAAARMDERRPQPWMSWNHLAVGSK